MADNGALHCRVILSQKLPSSTADRGRSRLGHLSQPRLFHGGNWGLLSLNNCSLPAEMQMCSQWRGFNLWRGQEGKERGSPSSFRLSIYSLPSTQLFRGLESICLYFKGNWAQMPGHSGRRRRGIEQGLEMGWGPSKTGLRGLLWAWERGMKRCKDSLLFLLHCEYWHDVPDHIWHTSWEVRWEGGWKLFRTEHRAQEDFLSSSVWDKRRAGLSPLPRYAKVRIL